MVIQFVRYVLFIKQLIPFTKIYLFVSLASFGTMDISALQKLVASDIALNRTPLFVIGDVGASICGQVDNIQRLQEVCRTHSIWLHCRGHSLAALAITQGTLQTEGQNIQPIADSMSLNLGSWLALPNLPVVVETLSIFLFSCFNSHIRNMHLMSLFHIIKVELFSNFYLNSSVVASPN